MSLRIRRLSIRVSTYGPQCGAEIEFKDGLNVLRADNTSGKSTCLQSIIYALGLEGMLGPRREVPLPHAMTDSISVNGRDFRVQESSVSLEFENERQEVLTVERAVKSSEYDLSLIRTWVGPHLSQPERAFRRVDYFVRRAGAAQRQAGFHFELARFLGWNLPQVTKMDGSESLLYMECLFPYLFVEQKHGWSGVQARIPSYLGIRDVSKRTAEFILGLDALGLVLQRQRLEAAGYEIEREWQEFSSKGVASAEAAGLVLRGVPSRPKARWTPEAAEILVPTANSWRRLDEEIVRLGAELHQDERTEILEVGLASPSIEIELQTNQERLISLAGSLSEVLRSLEQTKMRVGSLELRIADLGHELQHHRDAQSLKSLGSEHMSSAIDDETCPTCHQYLPDGYDVTTNPMSVDDNIEYIDQELLTFTSMRTDALRVASSLEVKVRAIRGEMNRIRTEMRAQKDSLVSPNGMPSVSQVAHRFHLQERLSVLRTLRDDMQPLLNTIASLAASWETNKRQLKELREALLSQQDQEKVKFLKGSLVQQLQEYDFRSLAPESIDISPDTYRPVNEGFDLGFDLSASDMIRVIWAYLFSFLEAGTRFGTNHPGLLIFDEPRQQEASRMSFAALLRRAGTNGAAGNQVIFATSEELNGLKSMLRGVDCNLIAYESGMKILGPRP